MFFIFYVLEIENVNSTFRIIQLIHSCIYVIFQTSLLQLNKICLKKASQNKTFDCFPLVRGRKDFLAGPIGEQIVRPSKCFQVFDRDGGSADV